MNDVRQRHLWGAWIDQTKIHQITRFKLGGVSTKYVSLNSRVKLFNKATHVVEISISTNFVLWGRLTVSCIFTCLRNGSRNFETKTGKNVKHWCDLFYPLLLFVNLSTKIGLQQKAMLLTVYCWTCINIFTECLKHVDTIRRVKPQQV